MGWGWWADPATTSVAGSRDPGPASAMAFPWSPALGPRPQDSPAPSPPLPPASPRSGSPRPRPCPHLLHVLLGPQVRGVHERAHDLDVAMHHQRLIRPVRVNAHTAMVEDRVRHLRPLPQHLAVTLKLAWIGGLAGVGAGSVLGVGGRAAPWERGKPRSHPSSSSRSSSPPCSA